MPAAWIYINYRDLNNPDDIIECAYNNMYFAITLLDHVVLPVSRDVSQDDDLVAFITEALSALVTHVTDVEKVRECIERFSTRCIFGGVNNDLRCTMLSRALINLPIRPIRECLVSCGANSFTVLQHPAIGQRLSRVALAAGTGDMIKLKEAMTNGTVRDVAAGDERLLVSAALGGEAEAVNYLITPPLGRPFTLGVNADKVFSALKAAVVRNCLDVVRIILAHVKHYHVDVRIISDDLLDRNPHAHYGNQLWSIVPTAECFEILDDNLEFRWQYLIQNKFADVWKRALERHQPDDDLLIKATRSFNSLDVYDELLQAGCSITRKDDDYTVIHRMPYYIRYFVDHGADVNAQLRVIGSVLHIACRSDDLLLLRTAISCDADVNLKNSSGDTPLMVAVASKFISAVSVLLEAGADPNFANQFGYTALHIACSTGFTKVAKLLIDAGADINSTDPSGYAPIHGASSRGITDIVRLLIDSGADTNITDKSGYSPIDAARDKGYHNIVDMLKAANAQL